MRNLGTAHHVSGTCKMGPALGPHGRGQSVRTGPWARRSLGRRCFHHAGLHPRQYECHDHYDRGAGGRFYQRGKVGCSREHWSCQDDAMVEHHRSVPRFPCCAAVQSVDPARRKQFRGVRLRPEIWPLWAFMTCRAAPRTNRSSSSRVDGSLPDIGHHGGAARNPLHGQTEPNGTSIVDVTDPHAIPAHPQHVPGAASVLLIFD